MKIIDHGAWVKYKPDKRRIAMDAPANAIFAKRVSDGVDWYDYVRPNFYLIHPRPTTLPEYEPPGEPNFKPGSVICNVYRHPEFDRDFIGTAVYDPTRFVPCNQRIIEITDYAGTDPHAEFGGKVYDREAGTFTVLVRPPAPPSPIEQRLFDRLDAITARLDQLERKING